MHNLICACNLLLKIENNQTRNRLKSPVLDYKSGASYAIKATEGHSPYFYFLITFNEKDFVLVLKNRKRFQKIVFIFILCTISKNIQNCIKFMADLVLSKSHVSL